MNRFWGSVLVAAGITLAFCTHAVASGQKIGYVDVARVVAQSKWGKQISSTLKSDQEKLTSSVQAKKDAFTAARDSYMKTREIMDAKARARKEVQLDHMAAELQRSLAEARQKWAQDKKAAMEPLFKKMYQVAAKVAKRERYDMIVDRSALIVINPKDDITSKVISELNRSH